jgi:hypothetical protein
MNMIHHDKGNEKDDRDADPCDLSEYPLKSSEMYNTEQGWH